MHTTALIALAGTSLTVATFLAPVSTTLAPAPAPALASTLMVAPEPEAVPRRWELEVKLGALRVYTMDIEGQGPRPFFYMTYKVTNNSGKDLLLAPLFEIADGSGKVIRSGRDVPAAVTAALIDRQQNPLMKDQIAILGPILQGPENAREGLIAWPAETLKPDDLTVYAAGFSGESVTVTPPGSPVPAPQATGTPASASAAAPGKKDAAAPDQPIVLRKTLMVRFSIMGELTRLGDTPIPAVEQRWVMR